ncbi:MAG: threonylcarbamoyl-AMP synthase [Chloroflexi bacterium]|nr:threonylcarbamoyl-AMP synthase [Chloroflexota bacterium]
MKRRAGLFLDRDGTIIEDCGHLRNGWQVAFIPDTVETLKRLQDEFVLFIITNQSGVADGALTLGDVNGVNNHIISHLADAGVVIQDVYVCPHRREDECLCIKPKPHFLYQAANRWNIDLSLSIVVGDHPHDVELANNVGGCGIYVLTGHGQKHLQELPPESLVVPRLKEAADWILALARYNNKIENLKEELRRAGEAIRQGQLVVFPTETVYGLGANACDAQAIARVFQVKGRPRFDPLIVHIADIAQTESLVEEFPAAARRLAENFWPGPLTLILPKNNRIPEIVTAGLPGVALRMPDNQLAMALIRESGVPIAAPSANPFGYISPTTADHVREQLGEKVSVILDGGPCRVGVESTIVSFVDEQPRILRPGGIPMEEIERIIGPVGQIEQEQRRPMSPGQLPRHYSPQTPLILADHDEQVTISGRVGLLSFGPSPRFNSYVSIEVLSQSCDLNEAASNLYSALRRLDAKNLDVIVAHLVPNEGLGITINNRLRKASGGRTAEKL